MKRAIRTTLALLTIVGALSGCDAVTGPKTLEDFHWEVVDNPAQLQEGIDAAAFAGDINILGQLRTPTLCFRLDSSFDRSGSTLTMRVTARSTNDACPQTAGGYQYTAALRHLDRGTYTVRVIHSVPGADDQEYSETVTL